MIYQFNNKKYNINLGGQDLKKLEDGIWKMGLIVDNDGITDPESEYYESVEGKTELEHKCLKNKSKVKLLDGCIENLHIIHWVPTDGYFFVTIDEFWDNFN